MEYKDTDRRGKGIQTERKDLYNNIERERNRKYVPDPDISRWLYLDDLRTPKNPQFDVVRTYEQFVEYITLNGIPNYISFDHDLGDRHMDHYHKYGGMIIPSDYDIILDGSGYSCAKWLLDYCEENDVMFKKVFIHSHNPVGGRNIYTLLKNYKKHKGIPDSEHNVWFHEPEYTMEPIKKFNQHDIDYGRQEETESTGDTSETE